MHDETVETYTNVNARWFAIISWFIVTASLCTLWQLQMTRYSQVLVHSTVVNSRLSHQYMSISLIFLSCFGIYSDFSYFFPCLCCLFLAFRLGLGAVFGISAVSATFCRVFSGFWAGFGSCFRDFCCFSYFFSGLFRLLGWVLGAVFGISAVSATFSRLFSGFWAGFGSCFRDFCCFSYFFSAFFRLYGWVWGAVLGISAVSATFCEASGIMVEAQHHKLTTTY